jgi:membrane-associated phospholipid phosphatase
MLAFLLVVYPRAGVVWWALAIGCAFARVRFHRHYIEDVVFGAAEGWLLSQWVFSWRWPARVAQTLLHGLRRDAGS